MKSMSDMLWGYQNFFNLTSDNYSSSPGNPALGENSHKTSTYVFCDFILGYLDVTLLTQSLSPGRITFSHTLVSLQMINRSHHLFGTVRSITVNLV
jgi:hypothetical protein